MEDQLDTYVVVTNSGGVSEIAEVGGDVQTLHIDYDDCNESVEEAIRYADEVMACTRLARSRKLHYLGEIFHRWPEAQGAYLANEE